LIVEVALGFFIIGNLLITSRWYAAHLLPSSGHRETDVVEVVSRGPAATEVDAAARRASTLAALRAIPDVRVAVTVSSTALDDWWGPPDAFWTDAGAAVGASACAEVARSPEGVVVGWPVSAGPGLVEALDLSYVEREPGVTAPAGVLVTRCLRDALFGGASALGRTLRSNRRPPARIVGVVEDVRLHVAFLYQTHVTAIYPGAADDPRVVHVLLRTESGRAAAVRDAVGPALAGLGGGDGRERLLVARLVSGAETRCSGIARGTVLLLAYVGGLLGVLAVLGNFAVAAFLVGDRRRVIGVRRALGARRWDILRYLLIENLLPTQLGNLLGLLVLLATLPAAKLRFAGIRFHVVDVLATAFLLSLGGILAKLLPALRATRIPPSEVTRSL
jgi:putative ABC transport system permease protein